jgi:hypothetical protein
MWVVPVADELYVRSAGGPGRPWYRRALASGTGRIRAGGVELEDFDSEHQRSVRSEVVAPAGRRVQSARVCPPTRRWLALVRHRAMFWDTPPAGIGLDPD